MRKILFSGTGTVFIYSTNEHELTQGQYNKNIFCSIVDKHKSTLEWVQYKAVAHGTSYAT